MNKLPKDNLRELLDNYYEEREVYLQLHKFYSKKKEETANLNIVWNNLDDDLNTKLKELDIDIQYIQEQLR